MRNKKIKPLLKLSITAVMIAMSVVVCRFLGFSPENTPFRFEIGYLPIAILAYMYGPLYSGTAYLIADILGSFASGYPPNPWIAACKLIFGVLMGLFLYHRLAARSGRKISLPRIILCFSVIAVAVEIVAMSPIFIMLYGYTPGFAYGSRALNALINLPIRIFLFYFTLKAISVPMNKYLDKNDKKGFREYANSFQAVTVPGLERIGALLTLLGEPHKKLKYVHVAGTNGKGSVSAYMASILEDAGYKVGKYISPNLIKVNERISVNGRDIEDERLNEILDKISALTKEVERATGIAPTQFEIWTAAAFVYFSEQACDYVVLEVGLGGEFDATNIIEANEIAIITRLGIDHTQYLGDSIEKIAEAKAGIIKAKSATGKVVTVPQDVKALAVLKSRAEAMGCELMVAEPEPQGTVGCLETFSLCGIDNIKCGIAGYHQIENASLAVMAAKVLGIDEKYILSGVARAKNPARFELIREEPTVIFDGGHNENGIEALTASLDRYYHDVPKTVIFACMRDKEIAKSLEKLNTGATEFVFTTVKDNPRASGAEELAKRAAELGFSGKSFEDIKEAYEYALSLGKLTVICGSLYLYKDFSEMLNNCRKE